MPLSDLPITAKSAIAKTWSAVWQHTSTPLDMPPSGMMINQRLSKQAVKPRKRKTKKITASKNDKLKKLVANLSSAVASDTGGWPTSDDVAEEMTSIWSEMPEGLRQLKERTGKKQLRLKQGYEEQTTSAVEKTRFDDIPVESLVIECELSDEQMARLALLRPSRLTLIGPGEKQLAKIAELIPSTIQNVEDIGFTAEGGGDLTSSDILSMYPKVKRLRLTSGLHVSESLETAASFASERQLSHLVYEQPNMTQTQLDDLFVATKKRPKPLNYLQVSLVRLAPDNPGSKYKLSLFKGGKIEQLFIGIILDSDVHSKISITLPRVPQNQKWKLYIVKQGYARTDFKGGGWYCLQEYYWSSIRNRPNMIMVGNSHNVRRDFGRFYGNPSGYYTIESFRKQFE